MARTYVVSDDEFPDGVVYRSWPLPAADGWLSDSRVVVTDPETGDQYTTTIFDLEEADRAAVKLLTDLDKLEAAQHRSVGDI